MKIKKDKVKNPRDRLEGRELPSMKEAGKPPVIKFDDFVKKVDNAPKIEHKIKTRAQKNLEKALEVPKEPEPERQLTHVERQSLFEAIEEEAENKKIAKIKKQTIHDRFNREVKIDQYAPENVPAGGEQENTMDVEYFRDRG